MTREEAIKILRREIECLSHTKCEDCILQVACDPIKTTPYDSEYIEVYEMAITALEQEPKTGHWIFQKIKYGEHLAPMRMWCSNCNSAFDLCCNQIKRYNAATRDFDIWIYCPWCGRKL